MTSYQKRKEEIKKITAEKFYEMQEFITIKHILLAIARGQNEHAKMTLKHFEKNGKIPACELEEIKNLIEKE